MAILTFAKIKLLDSLPKSSHIFFKSSAEIVTWINKKRKYMMLVIAIHIFPFALGKT